jgi:WD40 repeat protein
VHTGNEIVRLGNVDLPDDMEAGSQTVAFSPDEQYLAIKDTTKVLLIETATGRRTQEFAHAGDVWCIRFEAEGSRVLVSHGGGARWESTGGKSLSWTA